MKSRVQMRSRCFGGGGVDGHNEIMNIFVHIYIHYISHTTRMKLFVCQAFTICYMCVFEYCECTQQIIEII